MARYTKNRNVRSNQAPANSGGASDADETTFTSLPPLTETRYSENSNTHASRPIFIAKLVIALIVIGVAIRFSGAFLWLTIIIGIACLLLIAVNHMVDQLTIRVTNDAVYTLSVFSKLKVPLRTIKSIDVVDEDMGAGRGKRRSVQLTDAKGEQHIISSSRPDQLCAAIKRLKG